MQEILAVTFFLIITSAIVYQYISIRKSLIKNSKERRMLLRITLTCLVFSIVLLIVILQQQLL